MATSASLGRQGVRVLISKGLERAVAGKLARKIFGRLMTRRIPALAPILGTVAGGTINYMSMRAVGRAAVNFYSGREAQEPESPPPPPEPVAEPPKKARVRKKPAAPRKRKPKEP